ncbi:MAG: hypothetical protein K9G70_14540 [Prolixibacteraceae bacterium]|nr:hypothetical protein [Prolixibacteraceae bacterium]
MYHAVKQLFIDACLQVGLKYLAKDIETFEIKNKSCCNRKSCSLFIDYSTGIYCIAKENANTELEFYPIRPLNKCNIDKDKKYYKHEEFCTILKTKEKRKHDYIQK